MADKELSEITAAGTLDGTETVHVVQSGNSRRATAADIAQSSLQVDTYGLADVDTNNEIIIDLSNCTTAKIVIQSITASSSDIGRIRLSTDGGSTVESTSVYHRIGLDQTNSFSNKEDRISIGADNSTSAHKAIFEFTGHAESAYTYFTSMVSTVGDVFVRAGWIETTDSYNAAVIYFNSGSSFSTADVTVFRH